MTAVTIRHSTSSADSWRFLLVSITDSTRERNLSPRSELVPKQIFRRITLPRIHRSASLLVSGVPGRCQHILKYETGLTSHGNLGTLAQYRLDTAP